MVTIARDSTSTGFATAARGGAPSAPAEEVVRAVGVTKRFGSRVAVEGVTWSVRRGTVAGLVGPNGAGKTTLLRMIAGLVRPSSGLVEVDRAAVVSGVPPAGVGVLIESPGFVPHLSGRANLGHLARLGGAGADAVDEATRRVGLADRASDRYRTYSLGMKQRLGVAAALLGSPHLLVLDEPGNGLDPSGVADMHDLIGRLSREGVTVIVSSHALEDVERLCDEVAVMVGGRMVAQGRLGSLLGPTRTRIRSSPSTSATTVVAALAGRAPSAVVVEGEDDLGSYVEISSLGAVSTPELVRLLVADGVRIEEVVRRRRSLGETYAEVLDRHSDRAADPRTSEADGARDVEGVPW